jgi:hypothetical protein
VKVFALLLFVIFPVVSKSIPKPSGSPIVHLATYTDSGEHAKRIVVEGSDGTYVLYCNTEAAGRITPIPRRPYRLITELPPESTTWNGSTIGTWSTTMRKISG